MITILENNLHNKKYALDFNLESPIKVDDMLKEDKAVVLITGVRGGGKDHQSQILSKSGFKQFSFANALREDIWNTINWTPQNNSDYEAFKSSLITINLNNGTLLKMTGRDLLINKGQNDQKIYGKGIWVDKETSKVKPEDTKIVFSDFRFEFELEFIKQRLPDYAIYVMFSNYISPRYQIARDDVAEAMAIKIADQFAEQSFSYHQAFKHNNYSVIAKY